MRKVNYSKLLASGVALLLCISLSSCGFSPKMKRYYSQKENYINASGKVTHIKYNEESTALYLGFSELTPEFDDNSFKIEGNNLPIVKENGIDEKIKLGDKVEFVTAPKYFGDGYVMPIVAISVNGEVLLEFEEGYANYLEFLGIKQ